MPKSYVEIARMVPSFSGGLLRGPSDAVLQSVAEAKQARLDGEAERKRAAWEAILARSAQATSGEASTAATQGKRRRLHGSK